METIRTEEEILSGVTESYGRLGTQCSMIVGAFRKGVNWSDNHPRKGLVDIDDACEYLKANIQIPENVGNWYIENFIQQFRKAMEE